MAFGSGGQGATPWGTASVAVAPVPSRSDVGAIFAYIDMDELFTEVDDLLQFYVDNETLDTEVD